MNKKKMSKETFDKVFKLCRDYDPFTQYIDDYHQMCEAEEMNKKICAELDEILADFGLNYSVIWCGVDRGHKVDEAQQNLRNSIESEGVELEDDDDDEELPKAKKRTWTADEIRNLVQTNDTVLYRALKKLYQQQTDDEQLDGQTSHHNGAGFNSIDSKFLSSVSEFLIKRGYLTPNQKAATRKLLGKYTNQLTRLANA